MSAKEKHEQARLRRDVLVTQENEELEKQASNKHARSDKQRESMINVTELRNRKWLAVVNALTRFDWIFRQIEDIRTFKHKNLDR